MPSSLVWLGVVPTLQWTAPCWSLVSLVARLSPLVPPRQTDERTSVARRSSRCALDERDERDERSGKGWRRALAAVQAAAPGNGEPLGASERDELLALDRVASMALAVRDGSATRVRPNDRARLPRDSAPAIARWLFQTSSDASIRRSRQACNPARLRVALLVAFGGDEERRRTPGTTRPARAPAATRRHVRTTRALRRALNATSTKGT
jgi:hypothetical protein